jgi:hypothetical protein
MTNVFVEPRPKTQEDAIFWARAHGYTPHVARVRYLNDKKRPDHWRRVSKQLRFVSCYTSPADVIASLLMAASASLSRNEVLVLALAVRPQQHKGVG